MTFATWLQSLLDKNHLTQAAFSRAINVSRVCVSQWLSSDRGPSKPNQQALVKYFAKDCEETKTKLIIELFYLEPIKPKKTGN